MAVLHFYAAFSNGELHNEYYVICFQAHKSDWELATDRTLGYDLFTYICQVSILFEPDKDLLLAIDESMEYVKAYFSTLGISDYKPYLKAFAEQKWVYEESKENIKLSQKYKALYKLI